MWAYGNTSVTGTPSWNQSYNYSGPSWNMAENYSASTSPTYASNNGFNSTGLWGAALNGIGQYADARASAAAQQQAAQLSAQERLDQLKQQREYQQQDRQYKQQAASKWSKYFG